MAYVKFDGTITQLEVFIVTWELDDSMAYRWSKGATKQAKVSIAAQVLNNLMTCWQSPWGPNDTTQKS